MIEARDLVNRRTGATYNYAPFRDACRRIAESKDLSDFRRDNAIVQVIENVPVHLGEAYALSVSGAFPERWADVAKVRNDDIGGAARLRVDGVSHAPATWRYIFRALELERLFGPLRNRTVPLIVEVGGGYGGLAAAVQQLCGPLKWVILDAKEPRALQDLYLGALGIRRQRPEEEAEIDGAWGPYLVVSDYSISELGHEDRDGYRALLRSAEAVSIIWNEAGGMTPEQGREWLHGVIASWHLIGQKRLPGIEKLPIPPEHIAARLHYSHFV